MDTTTLIIIIVIILWLGAAGMGADAGTKLAPRSGGTTHQLAETVLKQYDLQFE
jgi:hypothetical protein